MDKEKYIIIGRSSCSFCIHAVDYCLANRLECVFLDYEKNIQILEDYKSFYDYETVPVILSNNIETGRTKFIGGYSDLLEYAK